MEKLMESLGMQKQYSAEDLEKELNQPKVI
jgi:hypothetical protein